MGTFTAPTQSDREFHLIKSEYASRSIANGIANKLLTQDDVNLIHEFIAELQASQGIGQVRVNKITSHLVNWRRFIGPYRSNTIGEIYRAIATIKAGTNIKGRPFKQNTLHDYILFLKRFYLWMIDNGYADVPREKVQKIRPPRVDRNTKLPEQLLTKEEIEALIRASLSSRDRALVALLYESGCRIGELARLTWDRIRFDEYGLVLTIDDTKCHQQRYVRLVLAQPYLAAWRQDYPHEPTGKHLVFITHQHKPLAHGTIYQHLYKLAKRAGITKKVTPHIFRHSRITHLINQGMKESVIKLMMWGNINTNMFATYAHLSGNDIDQEVLGQYGIVPKETQDDGLLEPVQCPHCRTINPPKGIYCMTCGRSLSEDGAVTQEEMAKDVLANPELVKKLLNELIEEKMRKGEI
ncbi:MAG: tyrosine-type recombinase/integrase [Methanomicrobiaceae archaeon]|nr:tyrosine-type recombinase/integrase [Methanomicrobiaceae archaeon]